MWCARPKNLGHTFNRLLPSFHTLPRTVNSFALVRRLGCTRMASQAGKSARIVRLPCPLRLAHGSSLRWLSPSLSLSCPRRLVVFRRILAQSKSIYLNLSSDALLRRRGYLHYHHHHHHMGCCWCRRIGCTAGTQRILQDSSRVIVSIRWCVRVCVVCVLQRCWLRLVGKIIGLSA